MTDFESLFMETITNDIKEIKNRLGAIEKKIYVWVGAANVIGVVVGFCVRALF